MEPAHGTNPESDRLFLRIAAAATALALGVLLAAVGSLRREAAGFSFQVGWGTAVGLAVGAMLGWWYWWFVVPTPGAAPRPAWVRGAASVGLLLVGVAAFVYPVRFLSKETMPEVLVGLLGAVAVLSFGAFLLWRIKRFLDRDERENRTED